ncbi:tetratricopeptide repeat protein [Catellatospora bangladeshensis]|uniref:Co-chaperone YbbN n=1 Tax=Catellatospora bangladeshensis TaxID=310355 RepID=A0A8J3JJI4_9ACTN|nr:tetratricopeptide repeat protein [Catellatospora bangladeshensis]GIF79698.1 co-chaperone YbbN [Catellatospora bangladeshensis]
MSDLRPGQSIFTRGAVDLGALAARNQAAQSTAAQQQAAPAASQAGGPGNGGGFPGAPAGGGVVVDVTEANVQDEVLQRSMTTPVVVAFLAPGYPEVQQLADALAQFNAADGGSWVLARVDVQADPRLAAMFRVQSVPTVYAVVGGQPIDAFAGPVPAAQLRQWLDAVLRAGGVEVAVPEDPRLEAADEALIMGDLDEAERAYRKILSDSPKDAAAEAGLAHVVLAKRVAGVDPQAAVAAADAAPDDVAAQLKAADIEVLAGQAEQAYRRLVELVRRVYGDDREAVRQHLVSLFAVAGPDDPAVATARRALASALF